LIETANKNRIDISAPNRVNAESISLMRINMKAYILLLTIAGLLLVGCSPNNASISQNKKDQKPPETPSKGLPLPVPPTNESQRPPKPAEDGRTVASFYDFLKSKGMQIDDSRPVTIRVFSAEESGSFKDPRNIGFLVLRYENAEKAQANFNAIDETYRQKFGRALIANNFVVAVFGAVKGQNKPQVIQYHESEYKTLQANLNEFLKRPIKS